MCTLNIGAGIGWMGDVQAAAQDPVFYVHHANLDRYEFVKAQGGGRVIRLATPPGGTLPSLSLTKTKHRSP
jgi:hypothetical protein